MPPHLQRQNGPFMYLCYEKYGMQYTDSKLVQSFNI